MSACERIRVLCVDDHAILRDGIAFAIQEQHNMEIVAEAANGVEACQRSGNTGPTLP